MDPNSKLGGRAIIETGAKNGHAEIVELLLLHGGDAKLIKNYLDDLKLLNIAAAKGHLEVVKKLIEAGAHIHQLDESRTPLMNAVSENQINVAKFLLEKITDVESKYLEFLINNPNFSAQMTKNFILNYKSPLQLAIEKNSLACIELLLKKGANLNQMSNNKYLYDMASSKEARDIILAYTGGPKYLDSIKTLVKTTDPLNERFLNQINSDIQNRGITVKVNNYVATGPLTKMLGALKKSGAEQAEAIVKFAKYYLQGINGFPKDVGTTL